MMETLISPLVKEPESQYSIRFQDCDPLGHLNNSRFVDYILNAREDHLEQYYNMRLMDYIAKGQGWVVANHEIYYLKQALCNEKVKIRTCVVQYSENDLIVEGSIYDEQGTKLKCLLWTRYVFVSARTGRKENHTAELMEFFQQVKNENITEGQACKLRLQQLLAKEKI